MNECLSHHKVWEVGSIVSGIVAVRDLETK